MFKYKEREYELDNVSVLSEDTDFRGELSFINPVRIQGKYRGTINSGSVLIISRGASVKADVNAGSLILEGVMKGDVNASEKVDIMPSGKLFGNITTSKLKIADGVIFEGTCRMIKKKAKE